MGNHGFRGQTNHPLANPFRVPLLFHRADADVFIPDGTRPPDAALSGVTDLCVAAHQDDIEIMAYSGIIDCLENPGKSFGGVVVTNGAGSPRAGAYSDFTDEQMQDRRREEQQAAAKLGGYAVQIQLAHPSVDVKQPGHSGVRHDLLSIFQGCRPELLYLHNPADKHDTHVAVFLRCLEVLRLLEPQQRPARVLGCAVWRDLEWLADDDKIALESGRRPDLAAALLNVFDSQISGGKRYDLATLGRRVAHATFNTPHAVDRMSGVTWAMDLTPLVTDPTRDVAAYTLAYVDRLRADIAARLKKFS